MKTGPICEPCYMCNNAKVDDFLTSDNDLSFHGVGSGWENYRFMIAAGNGAPVRILFEVLQNNSWHVVGVYHPRFCPNCGREILEYISGKEGGK